MFAFEIGREGRSGRSGKKYSGSRGIARTERPERWARREGTTRSGRQLQLRWRDYSHQGKNFLWLVHLCFPTIYLSALMSAAKMHHFGIDRCRQKEVFQRKSTETFFVWSHGRRLSTLNAMNWVYLVRFIFFKRQMAESLQTRNVDNMGNWRIMCFIFSHRVWKYYYKPTLLLLSICMN